MCPQKDTCSCNSAEHPNAIQPFVISDDIVLHLSRNSTIEVMVGLLLIVLVHIWIACLLYLLDANRDSSCI